MGIVVMETLINNFLIAISSGLVAISWFLIRRNHILSEKTGSLQSTIDAKNKEIECFISEREQSKKAQHESVINIENDYKAQITVLTKELEHLKSPNNFTKAVKTKPFNVFE